jgi:hypothetical protein
VGGSEGNARLTAAIAAVLLVLLAGEGATIPIIRQALTVHVVLGLILVPPVLLKLGSVAWRFARYYRRHPEYVAAGPPNPVLRFLVGPVVVVTTVTLFGTGILLVIGHPHGGIVLGLHKASFVIWFGAMSAHVLAHVRTVGRYAARGMRRALPGRPLRQGLLFASLVAGLAVGLLALPAARSWSHWASVQHRGDH